MTGMQVQVGSSYKTWKFILPLLIAILMLAIGIAASLNSEEILVIPLAIGGGFLFLAIIARMVIKSRRCWLEVTDNGFVLTDSKGRREFKDEDVRGISNWIKQNYSAGLLKSVTRHLRFWLDTGMGEETTRIMKHTSPVDEECPLGTLKDRVIPKLVESENAAIQEGKAVTGDGWELRRNELYVTLHGKSQSFNINDLSAAGYWDRHLCIWRKGEDEPSLKLDPETKNFHVLAGLLEKLIPEKQGEEAAPPAGSLGRILFERKETNCLAVFLGVLGVIGAIIFASLELFIPAIVVLGVGLAAGIYCRLKKRCFFRCHEYGVRQVGAIGEKTLRYENIGSFTYGATRQFVNGVYQGTTFVLGFVEREDAGSRSISYTTSLKGQDDAIETLREHISGVIAGRMAGEFAEGHPVQWTSGLQFQPEGLEYRAKGLLGGRKDPVFIPYGDINNYYLHEGYFYITTGPEATKVVAEEVSEPNFFPGYVLLYRLLTPDEESESPAE